MTDYTKINMYTNNIYNMNMYNIYTLLKTLTSYISLNMFALH